MEIKSFESPHFDNRRGGVEPSYVILHYTSVDYAQTHEIFMGENIMDDVGPVSAHYVIGKDGQIYCYVPEEKRAWHAGLSSWGNIKSDMNSHSIGVELVNSGDEPFDDLQVQVLIGLLRDIKSRHNISDENILGHEEIAPDRKKDPGPLFPWNLLAFQGVALWPRPENPAVDP